MLEYYCQCNKKLMNLIKNFKEITKKDSGIAGGKGASLGEMTQVKIPVPPGFVIFASAFENFLEITDLNVEIDAELSKVNVQEMHTIENASEGINSMIMAKEIPEKIKQDIMKNFKELGSQFVAVRSSATAEDSSKAAWAGQLETYLNTTEENIFENIKKCWASLFTPRAILYRIEQNLDKSKISVAVVVQKMVDSEISGITFTVHPVTQDKNQMIIEAGYGLGEAIVGGMITPDSYVLKKDDFSILDINVSKQEKMISRDNKKGTKWLEIEKENQEKQKLNNKEIIELAKLCKKIEDHYGFPCDIEWAYEKKKFYIVQSRPITTLLNK